MPVFKYDLSGFIVEFGYKNIKSLQVKGIEDAKTIEEEILLYIKSDNTITISKLVEKTKASKRTIERYIYKLREENKLRRIGSDKLGIWEIL